MGRKRNETIGGGAPRQEEQSAELSALGKSVKKYYRKLPSEQVDEIIRDRSAEAYIQRLCGLAMHYKRDFSPEQLDEMVNAVGADFSAEYESNPDFWGGVHPNSSLATLSATLASRHGQQLSEAQVNRLVEGHLANRLSIAALEPLLTQHSKDLSAYAGQLLEISTVIHNYDFSSTIIEHYGGQLQPEQVDELLDKLIKDKQLKHESLESEIEYGGVVDGYQLPYGRFAVVRDWEREMLLNGRAEGIHGVFANIIQHSPELELSAEQVDRLIEAGHGLTHARLFAFRSEGLTPEQRQTILSRISSTDLCRYFVYDELPMPDNKEELMGGMVKELGALDALDWRKQEEMSNEQFVRHLSAGNIDQLIEAGSEMLFKVLANWPGEPTPNQIDAIISRWESRLPMPFVSQLGSYLSPSQAEKVLVGSDGGVAAALIHNYPEYFSLSDTEAKIDMLLAYCKDSQTQSWLIKSYGQHFLPRQIDVFLDRPYGPVVGKFIEQYPDKFSPAQIKRAISGDMVKINKRSELFAMHRQAYLAEADELIASESPLTEYLIKQCGDDLSSAQIDQLIETDDLFHTQKEILKHCGRRLLSGQISRLMDIIRKSGGSSLYERVTKYEKEAGLMVKLVRVTGDRMTPSQIDGIIEGSSLYQSKLVSELLASHRECLSGQQVDKIVARFGHVL